MILWAEKCACTSLVFWINQNFKELSNVLNQLQFKILKFDLNKDEIPQALVLYNPGGNFLSYLRDNGIGAWSWPAEEIPLEVLQDRKNYPNLEFFVQDFTHAGVIMNTADLGYKKIAAIPFVGDKLTYNEMLANIILDEDITKNFGLKQQSEILDEIIELKVWTRGGHKKVTTMLICLL